MFAPRDHDFPRRPDTIPSHTSRKARIAICAAGCLIRLRTSGAPMRVPETPTLADSGGVLVLASDTPLGSSTAVSSARNTIETVFCLRRNHIPSSALNALFSAGDQWATGGREGSSNEKMRPMSRKTRIRCPLPQFVEWSLVDSCSLLFDPLRGSS